MSLKKKIIEAIHRSIDELNKDLDPPMAISKDPHSTLLGNSALDSMNFVSLVMLIEKNIEKVLGEKLDLLEEDFLMENTNPFSTIETLTTFVQKKSKHPRPHKT